MKAALLAGAAALCCLTMSASVVPAAATVGVHKPSIKASGMLDEVKWKKRRHCKWHHHKRHCWWR